MALYTRAATLASTTGHPLLAALADLGLARTAPGAAAGEARARGERALRDLAAAAGPGFSAWPERRPATSGPSAPAPGFAETLGLLTDLQAASSPRDLLTRALARLQGLSQARAGALVGFSNQQAEAHALSFLTEAQVFDAGLLDEALWYAHPVFTAEAWTLPVLHAGEPVAVLHLDGPDPARREAVLSLLEPLAWVIAQFRRLQAFGAAAERLALTADLAKAALAERDPDARLAGLLTRVAAFLGAERALAVRATPDGLQLQGARDPQGRALPPDAPFSRTVCQHVMNEGLGVRLLDPAQTEGWQQAQSILALGLHTLVAVPVTTPAGRWGVLYVDSTDVTHLLGGREQDLLTAAADVLGLAL